MNPAAWMSSTTLQRLSTMFFLHGAVCLFFFFLAQSSRTFFVSIPTELGGKSAARFVEAKTIAELQLLGFNLLSDNDRRNRNFAGGGGSPQETNFDTNKT